MNFNTEKPIYLQIVDVIADRIHDLEVDGFFSLEVHSVYGY